jgi:hypothetical protein
LLRFQLDELDGLGDQIRLQRSSRQPDQGKLTRAWQRCHHIVTALSWNEKEVMTAVRRLSRRPLERPEDTFGLTLVLATLSPGTRLFHRWTSTLSPAARMTLIQSGLAFSIPSGPRLKRTPVSRGASPGSQVPARVPRGDHQGACAKQA